MKTGENMSSVVAAVVAIIILLLPTAYADRFEGWSSFTSTSEVRYMDYFEDSLQVMTSGGWLKIDPATFGFRKITNSDGLGTNDLYYIMQDSESTTWIAGNGRLIKCTPFGYTPYLFFDHDNLLTLYTIEDDGDQLWIGTSAGLARFSKNIDGGQIEDFYYRYGDLSAEVAVNDILITGDSIWLATSDGVAVADKHYPDLLKSQANWNTFRPSDYDAASPDHVAALAVFHDKMYIGTSHDVYRLNIDAGHTVPDSLFDVPTRASVVVKHMYVIGDSLMIYGAGGYFIYTDPIIRWNGWAGFQDGAFSCGRIIDTVHWVGDYASGLYYETDSAHIFDAGGLPGKTVTALSSNADGRIVGGFLIDGIAMYDGNRWQKLDYTDVGEKVTSIIQDDSNYIWVSTWGASVNLITEDSLIRFSEYNSTLHTIAGASSDYQIVVNGLARTSHYLFMINFASRDGNQVRVVDLDDITRWGSFGPNEGIIVDFLYSIDCYNDVFVVGTSDKGVYYYYFGPDPFDKTDDSVANLREDNSWLGSDDVKTVKFDKDGGLWVGTRYGLSKYDVGIDRFVNAVLPDGFGPAVISLEFDRRGNIWMGSQDGLALYEAGTGNTSVFTTLNSGLTNDNIDELIINPATFDLWIGTPEGMAIYKSIIGPPTSDIEETIAFPNPFIIRSSDDVLSFNYDGEAEVRIFTANGELVRVADINVPWDGKNQQQQNVASGVYLYLLTTEDGAVGRGKILLIRK